MNKQSYIYILTNKPNGTLYVGVTSDLIKRVWEHKSKLAPNSFTSKYNINQLVYYEISDDINSAILREKQLKAGNRKQKLELITKFNPLWKDLYDSII
jgi:putative endonuclease